MVDANLEFNFCETNSLIDQKITLIVFSYEHIDEDIFASILLGLGADSDNAFRLSVLVT